MRLLLSKKYKIIFFWTSKSGGTTVKNIFYNLVGVNVINPEIVHQSNFINKYKFQTNCIPEDYEKYLKIQFVRNPYERAVSSFLQIVNFSFGECKNKNLNFLKFLEKLNEDPCCCNYCKDHACKQFMTNKLDEVVKIENIDEKIIYLNKKYGLKLNNIKCQSHSFKKKFNYNNFFSKKVYKLIENYYKEDIKFFNYKLSILL